ncbi:hypothetical protein M0805_000072 [Coniferiporia weirii]|nr:hypothetical protein M0805_000072 [Coniferiporia weirii]
MPSAKAKQRSKAKKTSSARPDERTLEKSVTGFTSLVNDIEGAEGWYPIVYALCNTLSIPDLSSRNGLKKIHGSFSEISSKLEDIFAYFCERDFVAQAVIAIYTRMCADAILRDRLIKETDLLSKVFALLKRPACCHVALQALCAITHHGGQGVRLQVAEKTPALLQVLEDRQDDDEAAELTLSVLAHSSTAVLSDDTTLDQKLFRTLEVPRLIRLAVSEVRKQTSSAPLISHALPLLTVAANHGRKELKDNPSATNLLVAFMRAPDVTTRTDAILGIMRLHMADSDNDELKLDPMRLLDKLRSPWPPHLDKAFMSYGPTRIDLYNIMQSAGIFQKAVIKVAGDRDFYTMGRTIGPLIMRTEFSVLNGSFQSEDGKTVDDLPFTYWLETLPLCAEALRARGKEADQELACTIELKHIVATRKLGRPENMMKITSSIARFPQNGYFRLVLSFGLGDREGLRAAKKGLKCPGLTDYVRSALLYRSASIAATIGLETVQKAGSSDSLRGEGLALLKTAWEDAKMFLETASPDDRYMASMVDWYIILTFALHGAETSVNLKKHQNALDRLKIADEISKHIGRPIQNTQARLSRVMLTERLPSAAKEWDATIARYGKLSNAVGEKLSSKEAEEDLATWLDKFEEADVDHDHEHHHRDRGRTHPKISPNAVELYRCAWCRNPSAVLKKCSSCEKTRYCDSFCQKEHWKEHRKNCKRDEKESTDKDDPA